MIYRGNFNTQEIIQAICESLSQPPQYCIDGGKAIEEEQSSSSSNSHLSIILIVSAISIVLVTLIGIFVYRKFIKRELTNDMVSKVGELVAHYANKVSKQKIRQKEKMIEENDE
jgi:uncharacterized protein YneF (UPF0154 family)